MEGKARSAPRPPRTFPESKRQLVLVDRPGSVQADIHIGRLAVTRTDPDYFPLLVGNAILGGGASSRLFIDVREKKDSPTTRTASWIAARTPASHWPSRKCATKSSSRPWKRCWAI